MAMPFLRHICNGWPNKASCSGQAFAPAPTCSLSRASFLTGLCPHSTGMLGLAHLGHGRVKYPEHIAHRLKAVGYQTVHCGIDHTITNAHWTVPYDVYDQKLGPGLELGAEVAPVVAGFLRAKPQQPFFMSVGLRETHTPFQIPPRSSIALRMNVTASRPGHCPTCPQCGARWRRSKPALERWMMRTAKFCLQCPTTRWSAALLITVSNSHATCAT